MDSKTFSVQQIFQDRRQYRVPFYQRPYVWNRDDQWGRLWEDIRDRAESRLVGAKSVAHFMGAVVLEPQRKTGLLGVERYHIIDGQQRLTTLQYVLNALTHVLRELDQKTFLPLVQGCLSNPNPETMEDRDVEVYKLWPTFRDRRQFVSALTAASLDELRERSPDSFTKAGTLKKIGVEHPPALEAICYFRESMIEWVREVPATEVVNRSTALATAVLTDLSIVCISLGDDDDAQVIFETLNGHGAQLHATDLIRNFIFMRAGNNADELYTNLWSQFESPLWAENQTRGRLKRPRLEWFVQTAIQAETGEEIDVGRLYAGYRRFVDASTKMHDAAPQLSLLNRYSDPYKALVLGAGDTPTAVFGRRLEVWDASTVHPLALRVAISSLDDVNQREIFDCIESYLLRRAVCGLSRKNYNKIFAQLLKKMAESGMSAAKFREALAELSGEASRWPRDEEFRRHWIEGPIYPGRLDAGKLRALFHRIEMAMRSEKSEERVLLDLDTLDIDHIMPQSWRVHWALPDGTTASEQEINSAELLPFLSDDLDPRMTLVVAREQHVPRIGNLTMVHYGVNRALQNREFSKKREAFFEHSNLNLNRELVRHPKWEEKDINDRAEALFQHVREIWRGP